MAPSTNSSEIYLGARANGAVQQPGTPGPGGLPLVASGKVRDLYTLDPEHLLFVTTDRVSAFDVVMDEGVPEKGRVLTAIAAWWFARTGDLVENHLVSTSVDDVPGLDSAERAALAGRIMIVRKSEPTTVEWVVRAYLAGSGWKEYRESGGLWGQALPAGLEHAARLPAPLLTPTTKDEAHDRPLSLEEARERVGEGLFEEARAKSLALFEHGTRTLEQHGLLLADTKFEFGLRDGRLILIDEDESSGLRQAAPARLARDPGLEQGAAGTCTRPGGRRPPLRALRGTPSTPHGRLTGPSAPPAAAHSNCRPITNSWARVRGPGLVGESSRAGGRERRIPAEGAPLKGHPLRACRAPGG
ncbi:MAG: phosphoribosylaminoimidazolesuccinocarboxamide synthase [Planctomycetota bacterium]|jgi:phosphoribosylaminoimidazole-succinocarboxamide synthase